jgi:phage protein D
MAKLETANRALAVVRNGRLIFQTLKSLAAARALPLQPGDVLRLADYG